MIHITLNNKGQITNDTLGELRAVLERNKPAEEIEFSTTELARQTLDIAQRYLKKSHVFWGTFADGTLVIFTGEVMPPGVTVESAVNASLKAWGQEAIKRGEIVR